jgi:hypothetical protein
MGFVVEKVALGQVFLRVFLIFPVSIIPKMIHTYSFVTGAEQLYASL